MSEICGREKSWKTSTNKPFALHRAPALPMPKCKIDSGYKVTLTKRVGNMLNAYKNEKKREGWN